MTLCSKVNSNVNIQNVLLGCINENNLDYRYLFGNR